MPRRSSRRPRSPWIALLALSCGLACDPSRPAEPGSPAAAPRGIFLIVVDTLRADRLSCYGYTRHRTPRIDALAASGVRFARARAVASWTVPSMGALLTSRFPLELGLVERSDDEGWRERRRGRRRQRSLALPGEPATLSGVLRQLGFRTAAFVDQPMLSPRHGFDRGFDDWFQPDAQGAIAGRDTDPRSRQGWASASLAYENDAALVDRFEAWLARRGGERVFVWLHLLTPHRPYTPPASAAAPAPDASQRERYDAEVRAVDLLVGRVLAAVEEHVGRDDALVALTSDHGEAFGEHGIFEHGNTLHQEVAAVPLLLSAPGRLPAGATVGALVRTIDIGPTLIDVAGGSVPPRMRGRSLLPLLDDPEASRPVYAEGVLYGASERAYTEDGWKLLIDGEDESSRAALFAIDRDPAERVDLAEQEPRRVLALRSRLEALRRGLEGAPPGDAEVESSAAREALRALGYLDGGEAESPP